MHFSKTEILHLSIAMTLVILVGCSLNGYRSISVDFLVMFGMSFLLHELAHKFLAQHYRSWAEFRTNMGGLMITAISALPFIPFKFIAPGAVMVNNYDFIKLGKVALVGPLVNIFFCLVFYCLYLLGLGSFFNIGANFNAWIAMFNLIPFGQLDGEKLFQWDKKIWAITMGLTMLLFIVINYRFMS